MPLLHIRERGANGVPAKKPLDIATRIVVACRIRPILCGAWCWFHSEVHILAYGSSILPSAPILKVGPVCGPKGSSTQAPREDVPDIDP